jgi:hypothetical protein
MSDPEHIVLTLVPLADPRPVEVRLRLVLKDLLRQQRFRCVGLTGKPPGVAQDERSPPGAAEGPTPAPDVIPQPQEGP